MYAGIGREPLINLGGDMWALFPWLGTYAFLAHERVVKIKMPAELGIKGIDVSRPYFMQFRMRADAREFMDALKSVFAQDFDPMELLYPAEVPVFEKYDEFVPPELVRKGFAYGVLDVDGARDRVLGWRPGIGIPRSGADDQRRERSSFPVAESAR
jgi:ATP-dependent Lhr-like helicase